jgi:hypothetical protein
MIIGIRNTRGVSICSMETHYSGNKYVEGAGGQIKVGWTTIKAPPHFTFLKFIVSSQRL